MNSLPRDQWLLKTTKSVAVDDDDRSSWIDMSRYLKSVKDDLDQWLAAGRKVTSEQDNGDDFEEINERLRPEVPSTLNLNTWQFANQLTKSDNSWLLGSGTKSGRFSSSSSRSSSFTSLSSSQFGGLNKWLINGGLSEVSASVQIPCAFMEKYRADMDKLCWVKCDKANTAPKSLNPLESYVKDGFDPKQWLKSQTTVPVKFSDAPTPLKAVIDFQKSHASNAAWLLTKENLNPESKPSFEKAFDQSDKIWLKRSGSPFKEADLEEEDLC